MNGINFEFQHFRPFENKPRIENGHEFMDYGFKFERCRKCNTTIFNKCYVLKNGHKYFTREIVMTLNNCGDIQGTNLN